MKTFRYIACGAAAGYLALWLPTAMLVDVVGLKSLMAMPVGLIVGGFCGYLYARTKQARHDRVVSVLPKHTHGSTHARAA
jgi:hypothetical protein